MRHLSCPETSETLGQNLAAFTDNMQGTDTKPVMAKYGMVDLDPNAWYSTRKLLDALNELAESHNHMLNFVAIGMTIGETIPLPPDAPTPTYEEILMSWNDVYQNLHRNGDVGTIRCEKISDNHYVTYHTDIYPDDMSYGLQYGYARRFLPRDTAFSVYYDPDYPARDYGGDGETIIHVEWE
ncbi:MAG TPA: hypothetical protein PKD09_16075 [Aggregatilinea sp.]|jgi:hypothetical protein|uniref:hypothetical protein n=1 Tax=Aggregatilinea sp. TaxID=2806333 RepID=UPI002C58BA39|nr:hypothetical protein [Aggregatilinea sp.]HML23172.1 hypothetical protein [Aggregatilinea sp.]